jgi:hypothetical protein
MCQKASDGPIMAFARVKKAGLRWTRGQPAAFRSSSLVERQFCAACGTPLTYNFIEGPNISVTIGILDHPEAARPVLQYSIERTLSWFPTIRALPGKRTTNSSRRASPSVSFATSTLIGTRESSCHSRARAGRSP